VSPITAIRLLDNHPEEDNSFKLIACLYRGSKLLCFGYNKEKTSPTSYNAIQKDNIRTMYDKYDHCFLPLSQHAEQRACRKNDSKADYIVVCRKLKNGQLANARPCNICMSVIKQNGINVVYYSNDEGDFVKEEI